MTLPQDAPNDIPFGSFPVPALSPQRPLPPAPGFGYPPPRPLASGPRVTVGILLALASGFIGCGWLAFIGLLLAYQDDAGSGWGSFGVVLGAAGLVIALSAIGGIGTATTARRPVHDHWVRVWIWMSCVFGGLMAAMVLALMIWFQVANP